jgi:hypothetical protein
MVYWLKETEFLVKIYLGKTKIHMLEFLSFVPYFNTEVYSYTFSFSKNRLQILTFQNYKNYGSTKCEPFLKI